MNQMKDVSGAVVRTTIYRLGNVDEAVVDAAGNEVETAKDAAGNVLTTTQIFKSLNGGTTIFGSVAISTFASDVSQVGSDLANRVVSLTQGPPSMPPIATQFLNSVAKHMQALIHNPDEAATDTWKNMVKQVKVWAGIHPKAILIHDPKHIGVEDMCIDRTAPVLSDYKSSVRDAGLVLMANSPLTIDLPKIAEASEAMNIQVAKLTALLAELRVNACDNFGIDKIALSALNDALAWQTWLEVSRSNHIVQTSNQGGNAP